MSLCRSRRLAVEATYPARRAARAGLAMGALLLRMGLADEETPAATPVWNKYPNSLLVRTRTASTYPRGLSVFTLVGLYQEFAEWRNPATGRMESFPSGMERSQSTGVLWGEYGVADRFQVGVNVVAIDRTYRNASGTRHGVNGLGDLSLYAKGKLAMETRVRPAVCVDSCVKLPTADEAEGLSNGQTDTTVGIEISKRFGALSAHLNPELTITGGDRSTLGAAADEAVRLNAGLLWHAAPSLLPSVEWNGLWWGDVGHQQELGGGVLWFPTRGTSVKAAVAVPVDTDLPWKADWTPWIKLATWF